MPVTPGQSFGGYRIDRQIGRGGMGVVFMAHQLRLGRDVAMKVLPDLLLEQPSFRERFNREASAIAMLRHPNILTVHDAGEIDGTPYIVSEYVEGGTLAARLDGPLSLPSALELLRPIAAALDHAHSQGIVHRDVKPSNILLRSDGTPVLSDFGLARIMVSTSQLTGANVLGTPHFMAPEQATADPETLGPATDMYALAVVAFTLLTGTVPFDGPTPIAVLLAHMHQPPPPICTINPHIPHAVEAVIARGLAKAPEERFPTGLAFMQALEAAGQPVAVSVPESGSASPAVVPPEGWGDSIHARKAPGHDLASPDGRARAPRYLIGISLAALLVVALAAATLARGETTAPPKGSLPAVAARWKLEAQDTFSGTALDLHHWVPYENTDADNGQSLPANISVAHGTLTLGAYKAAKNTPPTVSGLCWCFHGSMQIYGRWEVRARMDNGNGYAPAILLWSDNVAKTGAISLVTMSTPNRNQWTSTLAWIGSNKISSHTAIGDFSHWHTYGVEWESDHVSFFLDEHKLWSVAVSAAIPRRPLQFSMQVNANQGSPVPGQHIGLHVDWVKIYAP